ncbi:MAG: phosphoglucosamine mutase [Myxococcota bacterium]
MTTTCLTKQKEKPDPPAVPSQCNRSSKWEWFGTDGLRGPVNTHPITPQCMRMLGQALARLIQAGNVNALRPTNTKPHVVIGWDTRASSPQLATALSEGICSHGIHVVFLGVLPTAAVSQLVQSQGACAGLVVSASHNPASDNGVKILDNQGYKLCQQLEKQLQSQLQTLEDFPTTPSNIASCSWKPDAAHIYMQRIKTCMTSALPLKGLRIAIDCAQGAAYKVGPLLLQQLGAQIFVLADQPNGHNINQCSGSEYPQKLQQFVNTCPVDFAVALDGDADRCAFVDEKGTVLPGDAVLMLLATDLKSQNRLTNNTLVATVMSDMALQQQLQSADIAVQHTPVGDRHVVQRLREQGFSLGGEPSGHIVFWPHSNTADGLLATLFMASLLQRSGKPLSDLARRFQPTPRTLLSVPVPCKVSLPQLPKTQQLIKQIQKTLGRNGRIFVRYSGTEPKGRILLEGPDLSHIQQLAKQVARSWQQELLQDTKPPAAKQGTRLAANAKHELEL